MSACASCIQVIDFISIINKKKYPPPPSEGWLYGYGGTNIIDCHWATSVDAKFMGLIHRLKNLQGKAPSATHSTQLAKNNNAMWRVISNGDQPLPHLLRCPDLNKYQESQFKTEKAAVSPKKAVYVLKAVWPQEALTNGNANKVNL